MPFKQKMPSKQKKGQSSLEYLITYGWALVMIATIVGVLIFAAGGGVNTNTCTTFLHLICKGIGADGDKLILILQNATAQKITINPFIDIQFDDQLGYAEIFYENQAYRFEDVTIKPGTEFTIQGMGKVHADQISITYVEQRTGLTRTVTSNLSTDAPDDIEISNDGVDNDGDGAVDCVDSDRGSCVYVLEPFDQIPDETQPQSIELRFIAPPIPAGSTVTSVTLAVYVEEVLIPPNTINGSINFDNAMITPSLPASQVSSGWNFDTHSSAISAENFGDEGTTITVYWDNDGLLNLPADWDSNPQTMPKLILTVE